MKPIILCVDDEILILDSLKMLLKEHFGTTYSVETSENGMDALELIDELVEDGYQIPIMISDYVMPGIKGDELLIRAHKKIPDTLKIMLTGQADLRGVENAINQAQLYRFLGKPWTTNDFILTIAEALKSFSQSKVIEGQRNELLKSEKKYKELVENSLDIIFSLDKDEKIISINQSVTKILRFKPNQLVDKKFTEIIYVSDWMNEKIFQEKVLELIHSKSYVTFSCDLITAQGEPKEMQLKLQYLNSNDGFTILGIASSIEENQLIRLCERENQFYKIGNYVTQIDLICKRLTSAFSKKANADDVFSFKLSLRELLLNAMEHGNLNITFEEKSLALVGNTYYQLLSQRQNNPPYTERYITIEYSLDETKIEIRITDEGNGFDHKSRIKKIEIIDENDLGHGRGLAIAKDFFNKLEYNEKGNSVYLVREFPK